MVTVNTTKKVSAVVGVNILIYGRAGIGKTMSLADCPSPIIISAEGGLLSLQSRDIPYVTVKSAYELREVYMWLKGSEEANGYETVAIDSISEVCDQVMIESKVKAGRQAGDPAVLYPMHRATVLPILTAFRDLPRHFVATAKEQTQKLKRETLTMPAVIGSKLSDDLPYVFDVVLHYTLDGEDKRIVHTDSSCGSIAKDRTGLLPATIKDTSKVLRRVINKITGGK